MCPKVRSTLFVTSLVCVKQLTCFYQTLVALLRGAYPNHPNVSRRQPCGASLFKIVRTSKLVPLKVFPYFPLSKSLEILAKRPGFFTACEEWRDRARSIPSYHLGDIYDGQIWHDFNSATGHRFLCGPMAYLVTLNVDWFQTFLHTQYSVGAMYLTVQNLPRSIRCKEENVILVGVMPGPSEPELAMNSSLSPLVENSSKVGKRASLSQLHKVCKLQFVLH